MLLTTSIKIDCLGIALIMEISVIWDCSFGGKKVPRKEMEGRKAKVSESWGMSLLNWCRPLVLNGLVGYVERLVGLEDVLKFHGPSLCSGGELDTQSLEQH